MTLPLVPPVQPPYRKLETVLRRFFLRMRQGYLANLQRQPFAPRSDFRAYSRQLAELVKPLLAEIYLQAGKRTMQDLTRQVRGKSAQWRVKRIPTPSIGFSFNLFNPRILDAIDAAAMAFAQSTLDTITGDVSKWEDVFRQHLRQGLEQGEGVRDLGIRAGQVFSDPNRAFRAAVTEASRAVHAAEVLAAKESEVVDKKQWLASTDACEACLSLHGKTVGIDDPFWVNPKGGPYAVILHPPLHPHCMCSEKMLVNFDLIDSDLSIMQPSLFGVAV